MAWKDNYPLPWSVGPLGGGTCIVDATGKTVLEMGWLSEYECDSSGTPIISDRQKENWGREITDDPEVLAEVLSDGHWESRQVFELAGFIADAINKAGVGL